MCVVCDAAAAVDVGGFHDDAVRSLCSGWSGFIGAGTPINVIIKIFAVI